MGLGLVITALDQERTPWKEVPSLGQVRMTGDQVQRIFGPDGSSLAAEAPDLGSMGGQFGKASLREMLPKNSDGLTADDTSVVDRLRGMCEENQGRGAFSIRPLRLP